MSNRLYKVIMKCGHSANATTRKEVNGEEIPCCVMCGCTTIDDKQMDLTNRKAKCFYCDNTTKSELGLAFFAHCPNKAFDNYYCGCEGWD